MVSFQKYARQIVLLHQESILSWKKSDVFFKEQGFFRLVEENHAFNYLLWHAEDKARRDDMGFEFVYRAKRAIDEYNQQRNNRMETMDEWLFKALDAPPSTHCCVHSETPGMMIDRLSILALKSYHMALQSTRKDVDSAHLQASSAKWQRIEEQKKQLEDCLHQLLQEVTHKTRTFRIYHQFKMYNDPSLNPELYQRKR